VPHVSVVLQRPTSPFKRELGEAVAICFQEAGIHTRLVVDGDPSFMDAPATVLLGDCLGFPATTKVLRRSDASRPETTLWQVEPFPPALDAHWRIASWRASFAARWATFSGSSAMTVLRSLTPRALRARTRSSFERRLVGERQREDGSALELRNRHAGVRRFARVAWIQRSVQEGWLDHVVVTAPERREILAAQGIESRFLPIGYHPEMGADRGRNRDLDVVFLGRVKRGRAGVLDRLVNTLEERGVRVSVNEGPCFGEERNRFLNRAKISVNILNDVWELSRTRLLLSMACGVLVVSEPVGNPSPFLAGEHLVFAPADEMPDLIAHFLSAEDQRLAIVRRATKFISEELTMHAVLSEMAAAWRTNPLSPTP
jgi:hypothetical protein